MYLTCLIQFPNLYQFTVYLYPNSFPTSISLALYWSHLNTNSITNPYQFHTIPHMYDATHFLSRSFSSVWQIRTIFVLSRICLTQLISCQGPSHLYIPFYFLFFICNFQRFYITISQICLQNVQSMWLNILPFRGFHSRNDSGFTTVEFQWRVP